MAYSVVLEPPVAEPGFAASMKVSAVAMIVADAVVGEDSIVAGAAVGDVIGVAGTVVGEGSSVAGTAVGEEIMVVGVAVGAVMGVADASGNASSGAATDPEVITTDAGTGMGDVFRVAYRFAAYLDEAIAFFQAVVAAVEL